MANKLMEISLILNGTFACNLSSFFILLLCFLLIFNLVVLFHNFSKIKFMGGRTARTNKDSSGRVISGSRPASPLMGRVLFNCNRAFNGFVFIFLNVGRVHVFLCPPRLYLKNIFVLFYFIL